MSTRASDEVAGGPARDPVRTPGWLRTAALVALACLTCWALVTRDDRSSPPAGAAEPTPLGHVAPQRALVLGSQPGLLGVRATCILIGPDQAVALGVDLVNGRLARTTLLAVSRIGTGGGPTRGGAVLPARRTCHGRSTLRSSLVMRPGGIVPMRIRLRHQDLCGTRPVSVQVDVAFLGPGERPATQRLVLHPTELDVAICPTR